MAEAITRESNFKRPMSEYKIDLLKAGTGRLSVVFGGQIACAAPLTDTTIYTNPAGKKIKVTSVTMTQETSGTSLGFYDATGDDTTGAKVPCSPVVAERNTPQSINYLGVEFDHGITLKGSEMIDGRTLYYQVQGYLD